MNEISGKKELIIIFLFYNKVFKKIRTRLVDDNVAGCVTQIAKLSSNLTLLVEYLLMKYSKS